MAFLMAGLACLAAAMMVLTIGRGRSSRPALTAAPA